MRMKKVEPPAGKISPYKDSIPPCIPGWNCSVPLDDLEKALLGLESAAKNTFELARSNIEQARRNGVLEFEVRHSEPIGPAPDREGTVRM